MEADAPYLSAKQLAARWGVAVSSVHRIAMREGFHRLLLGTGKNGTVRYLRKEVEAYETARII